MISLLTTVVSYPELYTSHEVLVHCISVPRPLLLGLPLCSLGIASPSLREEESGDKLI